MTEIVAYTIRYRKSLNNGSDDGEEKKHMLYVTPKEVILNHSPTYFSSEISFSA